MTLPLERATNSDLEAYIADVLPWLQEAGQPYFDWIFGGSAGARLSLDRWMRRPSSEVAVSRVTPLLVGGRHIGGFIAMGGTELAGCRKADALAFLQEARNQGTGEMLARMGGAHGLFPPIGTDEFYLSKMGVVADCRGCGWGRHLALTYLAMGREAGFERFRLDVWAENARALRLYESLGFRVIGESASPQAGMRYLSMFRGEMGDEPER